MNTIELPHRGLTLLPPWPQAIIVADKRLENRGYGVARQLGDWRGLIALSQSKGFSRDWTEEDAWDAAQTIEEQHGLPSRAITGGAPWVRWAGCLVAVAELMDVLPPERCDGAPWHVPGQWGLILGRVWQVEPVPCVGGVGAWTMEWCGACLRPLADSSRGCPAHRGERRVREGLARPSLRVIRECTA